jgi:hypothetical protein
LLHSLSCSLSFLPLLPVQTFLLAVISHLLTAQPLSRTCYSPSSPVLLAVLSPFAFFSDFSASCPMSHLLTAQQLSSTCCSLSRLPCCFPASSHFYTAFPDRCPAPPAHCSAAVWSLLLTVCRLSCCYPTSSACFTASLHFCTASLSSISCLLSALFC